MNIDINTLFKDLKVGAKSILEHAICHIAQAFILGL
jgi:hypothetical protein